jgi:hypothetical protein
LFLCICEAENVPRRRRRRSAEIFMHRSIVRLTLAATGLAFALLLAWPAPADALAGDWTFVPPQPARRGPYVADLDGDGSDELVTIGLAASPNWPSPPSSISAWTFSTDSAEASLTHVGGRIDRFATAAFVVHDAPGFPGASIFVSGDSSNLLLRGTNLATAATFPLCNGPVVFVGDLEGNGRLEAVESVHEAIAICDATTGETLRSVPGIALSNDIAVGQLDDDPALEIVAGGNPLRVIDAATLDTEWTYDAIGLRPSIAAAATGSSARFVFENSAHGAVIVATHPLRVDHAIPAPANVFPVVWNLVDTDGDGASELLLVDTIDPAIHVLDPATGALRYAIETGMGMGDPVGSVILAHAAVGAPQRLVWVDNAGPPWNGSHLFVAAAAAGATAAVQQGEGVSSLAVGDVDGDGADEVIAASGYGATATTTRLRVLDRTTGIEKWAIDYADGRYGWPAPVAVAKVEANAPARIFAAKGTTIAVFDGVTETERYTMDRQNPSLWLPNLFLLRTADVDADGRVDLVAADSGSGVYAIDTATAAIEWLAMPFAEEVRDAEIVDRGAGVPPDLLIVQSPHIALLSGASHAVLWSQALPSSIRSQDRVVATYVAEGVDGPEIIVGAGDELTAFDATTGLLLRTVPLYDVVLASAVRFLAAPSGRVDRLLVSTYAGIEVVDGTVGGRGLFPLTLGANAGGGNTAFIAANPASGRHELIIASDGGFMRRSIVDRDLLLASGFDPD